MQKSPVHPSVLPCESRRRSTSACVAVRETHNSAKISGSPGPSLSEPEGMLPKRPLFISFLGRVCIYKSSGRFVVDDDWKVKCRKDLNKGSNALGNAFRVFVIT